MLLPDTSSVAFASSNAQQAQSLRNDEARVATSNLSQATSLSIDNAPSVVVDTGQGDSGDDQSRQERQDQGGPGAQNLTEQLRQRLEEAGASLVTDARTQLAVNFDDRTERFVYETRDRETGELVRQYPSEEFLESLATLREVRGLTVDDTI